MVNKEQFLVALGYFKAFHLSDTQLKKIFEHFMEAKTK
jgi:hypothetical protein